MTTIPSPIYTTVAPTSANLKHLDVGTIVVMKNLYARWNELIGSRWFVVRTFVGATQQTKITVDEKNVSGSINVYVVRPLYPHHAQIANCQTCDWEVSEGTLYEFFDIQEYKTNVQAGPLI